MKRRVVVLGCLAMMSVVLTVSGKTVPPQQQSPAPIASSVSAQQAIINQYCATCHSERAKAAGMDSARKLTLDSLDLAHVGQNAEVWEKVVRKLRAGMMPPAGMTATPLRICLPPVFTGLTARNMPM